VTTVVYSLLVLFLYSCIVALLHCCPLDCLWQNPILYLASSTVNPVETTSELQNADHQALSTRYDPTAHESTMCAQCKESTCDVCDKPRQSRIIHGPWYDDLRPPQHRNATTTSRCLRQLTPISLLSPLSSYLRSS
jgi:hypothetical protein